MQHRLSYALVLSFSLSLSCIATHIPEAYVVYMGSSSTHENVEEEEEEEEANLQLLSSVVPSDEKERLFLIRSYNHAFKGFSAMLSEKEAVQLSEHAGVVSVFRDQVLPLHTTRSWDFLDAEAGASGSKRRRLPVSDDVIIGIVDTGIWPESPSFRDTGMSAIPSRWKGVCMEGFNFKKSNCNRKLIGARFYDGRRDSIRPSSSNGGGGGYKKDTSRSSARDTVGHGTHVASTAAGAHVANASYFGLALGTARGGSPSSRLAIYKACSLDGCASSDILKAIDDAVKDGVDVISISIGISPIFQSDFLSDPISIGAFHANEKGVMVVCSGGNDGPDPFTVVNSAPWITTVAASSIDRNFESDVVLGNGVVIKGNAINFSNVTRSKSYPLVFAGDVAGKFTPVYEASNCYPGSLDQEKVTGKIVVCVDSDATVSRRIKKLVAQGSGAEGLIVIDDVVKGVAAFDAGVFPFTEVGNVVGARILKYINSTRKAKATILPSTDENNLKPAPTVAYFSARGPGGLTESILKPDIMAPGVGILAASIPATDASAVPAGKKPSKFAIKSGTSMASPHVAGAAAFVKSVRPKWTASMIKSALMTTATTFNNLGGSITAGNNGSNAIWHETGAGEINPLVAIDPGLVYKTTTKDYLYLLCYHGYKQKLISSISGTNFTCPTTTGDGLISTVNYPSISIAKLEAARGAVKVSRTATNVGGVNSTYVVSVDAPEGVSVAVLPERLVFSTRNRRASFEVSFEAKGASRGYGFGSLVWSDGVHSVRTVFAVNVV